MRDFLLFRYWNDPDSRTSGYRGAVLFAWACLIYALAVLGAFLGFAAGVLG